MEHRLKKTTVKVKKVAQIIKLGYSLLACPSNNTNSVFFDKNGVKNTNLYSRVNKNTKVYFRVKKKQKCIFKDVYDFY